MSKSSKLTNEIIGHIYRRGGFAWRAGSTGIMDARRGLMRTAPKKGVSDVIAVYKGRIFAIEVKIGRDILSPEQEGFLQNIEHYGGHSFVARDFESFEEWWKKTCALY